MNDQHNSPSWDDISIAITKLPSGRYGWSLYVHDKKHPLQGVADSRHEALCDARDDAANIVDHAAWNQVDTWERIPAAAAPRIEPALADLDRRFGRHP